MMWLGSDKVTPENHLAIGGGGGELNMKLPKGSTVVSRAFISEKLKLMFTYKLMHKWS